ncbi:MAG: DUF695 domain-containing protein [Candidatus Cloacimonetes bacterium]|nr:DUF695 domain-containing protein [Candidatus Cloacimonadota bacterium]
MDLIQELNKKLGPTPRKFSFLDKLIYLKVSKPLWAYDEDSKSDKLNLLFENYKDVFINGIIVWAKVIQANQLVWEPGDDDVPGEIVYSFDEAINKNPKYLIPVAKKLFALKETKPEDRKLREIADYLTNERTRVFGLLVPSSLSEQHTCRISTTFFVTKHLHESYLKSSLIPVFVSPGKPYLAMPVPCKYWEPHHFNDSEDQWVTYPVQVEEVQTWITTNLSYKKECEDDELNICCMVRVKYAEDGMPSSDDYEILNKVDDLLVKHLNKLGNVQVAIVTAEGHRTFVYHILEYTQEIVQFISEISYSFGVEVEIIHREDKAKAYYLEFLYPQKNDWQIIRDLQVLDQLHQSNDDPSIVRKVEHFAYFNSKSDSHNFRQWLIDADYILNKTEQDEDGKFMIVFSHEGTTYLDDIAGHTVEINNQCLANNGDYDGWETSVEEKSEVSLDDDTE